MLSGYNQYTSLKGIPSQLTVDCRSVHFLQANNLDIIAPIYKGYGKDFMRKYKLHPDSYVQMALQMAYYRIYKK